MNNEINDFQIDEIEFDQDDTKYSSSLKNNFFIIPMGLNEILRRIVKFQDYMPLVNRAFRELEIESLNSKTTLFKCDEAKYNDPWFQADNYFDLAKLYEILTNSLPGRKRGSGTYTNKDEFIKAIKKHIKENPAIQQRTLVMYVGIGKERFIDYQKKFGFETYSHLKEYVLNMK